MRFEEKLRERLHTYAPERHTLSIPEWTALVELVTAAREMVKQYEHGVVSYSVVEEIDESLARLDAEEGAP